MEENKTSTYHRKTITISDKTWQKYCKLKGEHLRNTGKPEITFTEYVNAYMELFDLTLKNLLELRRREKQAEGHN